MAKKAPTTKPRSTKPAAAAAPVAAPPAPTPKPAAKPVVAPDGPKELSAALVALCDKTRFKKLYPLNRRIYNLIAQLDKAIQG